MATTTAEQRREQAKRDYDAFLDGCPTRELLSRLTDKWVALVIPALADGPQRHGELARRIAGVSQKMLTQTLRDAGARRPGHPHGHRLGAGPRRLRAHPARPRAVPGHARDQGLGGDAHGPRLRGPHPIRRTPLSASTRACRRTLPLRPTRGFAFAAGSRLRSRAL